jgi:8-oxo-dGTP pyrophosphatase MutT (NUDIX family)
MAAMDSLSDQVRRLLAAYEPSVPEASAHRRMVALLEMTGDVFSSEHYVPGHFTASGVVTTPRLDAVVLIDHAKLGAWLQPGGHFEPIDRGPDAAARREITEECGIAALESEGLFDVDVHDIPGRKDTPPHAHFDLRFLFTTPETRLEALDGVLGARWVAVDEHIDRLGSTVRRLLDKVAALA